MIETHKCIDVPKNPGLICSGSRQRKCSEARALVAYLAVGESGHSAADVARFLGVKRVSVHHAVSKGKAFLDKKAHPLIEGR